MKNKIDIITEYFENPYVENLPLVKALETHPFTGSEFGTTVDEYTIDTYIIRIYRINYNIKITYCLGKIDDIRVFESIYRGRGDVEPLIEICKDGNIRRVYNYIKGCDDIRNTNIRCFSDAKVAIANNFRNKWLNKSIYKRHFKHGMH